MKEVKGYIPLQEWIQMWALFVLAADQDKQLWTKLREDLSKYIK